MNARAELEPKGASASPRGVHDMTQGKPRSHVVRVMLFILAGMTIQTLYGLVDIYWVGRLGKEAVAAVALSSNLMFVALAATQMFSVGCVALVSQAAGRKEHEEVQRLFNQAQSLATWAGALFLVAGLALHRTYAEKLSGDAVTAELAGTFLRGFIPALALQFTMIGLGSALRGIGEMKPGLVAQTASVLLNLVLAPFLVFGWGTGRPLGVYGAALATLIATAAAVLGLMVYLVRGKTFLRLRFRDWRPDLTTWRKMLGIGLPAGAEFLLLSITIGVTYAVTRQFGAEAQAGFGIGSRLPGELVSLFSPVPGVVAAGVDYLTVVSWGYFASGMMFVGAGVFQGLGNTWPSLLASGTRTLAFTVPVLVLSWRPGFQLHTIWIVWLVTAIGQLGLQLFLLRRELALKAPVPVPTVAS
jgi:Na+-driven multidrug efflux pump